MIRTTLGYNFILNGLGVSLALIGLVLLLADSAIADVVGVLFLFIAIVLFFLANKEKCRQLVRSPEAK